MNTIGIIGSGNMAEAIIKGILAAGLYRAEDIMASDIRPERLDYIAKTYKVKTTPSNEALVQYAKMILICVKPQNVKQMLAGIAGKTRDNTLVISIAAGISTAYLSSRLSNCQIIRAMPNTPAMIGHGATALYAANASEESVKDALKIFRAVGKAAPVDKEELIDAVTAVSGSGPAYFFLLMEQMVEAAIQLGLEKKTATELVLQTAQGSALLANAPHTENPSELRRQVTSPGGTTEAAMKIFAEHRFDLLVQKAIKAAHDRCRQLSN